jgi:cell division cycle protein 20 (cofactor of APC complex)
MKMRLMRSKTLSDLDGTSADYRIVAYRRGLAPRAPVGYRNKPAVVYSCIQPASSVKRTQRYVPKSPQRILDAPTIRDDFYLNLLDWGHGNVVAVALENVVYLWNAESGDVDQLDEVNEPMFVSSVKWSHEGKYLSVGLSNGSLRLYDPRQKKLLRTLTAENSRIPSISWRKNIVSCGSKTGRIYNHDVRVRDSLLRLVLWEFL